MKDKQIFFNPFRIISPKLNAEASRLAEIFESPSSGYHLSGRGFARDDQQAY